jgi:hypothetical protein
MPAKNGQISPQPTFGAATVTAVVRAASLSCQNAGKAKKSTPVRESSGEYRLMDKDGRYIGLVTYKEPDASAIAKLRALIAGKRDQFDPTRGRDATAANQ